MTPCIDIVLATFNGERFLAEQIASIQSCASYRQRVARLIIVDDGSGDGTQHIVQRMQRSDPRLEWHPNPGPEHGPLANFGYGLSLSTAPYIMLSDQDDVWHPSKIERSYHALHNASGPALVFSDKRVVNQDLQLLCPSFFELRNISRHWHQSLEGLLQQNVASGCTMLFNRALLDLAMPLPQCAFMHDWWLMLVASLKGRVVFIDQPLLDYRQHSSNSIGAKNHSLWYLTRHFVSHLRKFKCNFWRCVQQAEWLKRQFPDSAVSQIPYAQLRHAGYWRRLALFARGRVRQHNWKGQLALLLTLLTSIQK